MTQDSARLRTGPGGLDAYTLKLIAIAAMLIDHIGWAFVATDSILGQGMHIIGRITGPVMCFFVAEGYHYTRSVPRYALRLLAFAAVSYVPFVVFETGALPGAGNWFVFNVLYTLLLGLLALWAWDRIESRPLKWAAVAGLCVLSVPGDWSFFGVLMVLAFGRNRGGRRRQTALYCAIWAGLLAYCAAPLLLVRDEPAFAAAFAAFGGFWHTLFYQCFFQLGLLLPLLLLRLYNGRRGGGPGGRWLFYIFYPAHLTVIALLRWAAER